MFHEGLKGNRLLKGLIRHSCGGQQLINESKAQNCRIIRHLRIKDHGHKIDSNNHGLLFVS
jgi:hypothetical protein